MLYLLPLKARAGDDLTELAEYVRALSRTICVVVVDGSDRATYERNHALFAPARHLAPDPRIRCVNGKVAGVLTGFALGATKVVVADDDVRYDPAALAELSVLLDAADLVVPQNFYAPLSWPARWDTARILLNRLLPGGDFPGTLGIRLSDRMRRLGYDGDVLFENLELIRTVRADGGRVMSAQSLYVPRRPPTLGHFLGQRIREAYDSQAQPVRLVSELALLPLAVVCTRRPAGALGAAVVAVLGAALGRHKQGGAGYFPMSAALLAPGWLAERAVCSWIALAQRALGGTPYGGERLMRAASSVRRLRRARSRADDCRRTTA